MSKAQNNLRLYVLVWEFDDDSAGAEWTHVVREQAPDQDEQMRIILDFMHENMSPDYSADDIADYWINEVPVVDGHRIVIQDKV